MGRLGVRVDCSETAGLTSSTTSARCRSRTWSPARTRSERPLSSGSTLHERAAGQHDGVQPAEPAEQVYCSSARSSKRQPVVRAGLASGALFGVRVEGRADRRRRCTGASDSRSESMSPAAQDAGADASQAESSCRASPQFRRVEDGPGIRPSEPLLLRDDRAFGDITRLWRPRFDDVGSPAAGGTIIIAPRLDRPARTANVRQHDRRLAYGHVLFQEDPGNNAYLAKIWQSSIADSGALTLVAEHDADRFVSDPPDNGTSWTQDENRPGSSTSSPILGAGCSSSTCRLTATGNGVGRRQSRTASSWPWNRLPRQGDGDAATLTMTSDRDSNAPPSTEAGSGRAVQPRFALWSAW